MRTILTLVALLAVSATVTAQPKPAAPKPVKVRFDEFEIGRKGELLPSRFVVEKVIGKTEAVVRSEIGMGKPPNIVRTVQGYALLKGVDTTNFTDGQEWWAVGIFTVTGTTKIQIGSEKKTVFVIEAESKEERQKRIDSAAAAQAAEARREADRRAADAEVKAEKAKQEQEKKAAAAKAKRQEDAAGLLEIAKEFVKLGKPDKATERLQKILREYSDTTAAKEAKELLEKLSK